MLSAGLSAASMPPERSWNAAETGVAEGLQREGQLVVVASGQLANATLGEREGGGKGGIVPASCPRQMNEEAKTAPIRWQYAEDSARDAEEKREVFLTSLGRWPPGGERGASGAGVDRHRVNPLRELGGVKEARRAKAHQIAVAGPRIREGPRSGRALRCEVGPDDRVDEFSWGDDAAFVLTRLESQVPLSCSAGGAHLDPAQDVGDVIGRALEHQSKLVCSEAEGQDLHRSPACRTVESLEDLIPKHGSCEPVDFSCQIACNLLNHVALRRPDREARVGPENYPGWTVEVTAVS